MGRGIYRIINLVLLKASRLGWGPNAFKVNHCWFQHKDFISFVEKEWNLFDVKGSKAFFLKEKFKLLRDRLRWWNSNIFGWVDLKIEEDVEAMNKAEEYMLQQNVQVSEVEMEARRENQIAIWKNLHLKESLLLRKSRYRWLKRVIIILDFFMNP